ncbi:MAG TPA: aldehyde dehydrogenase family protein, partial [Polyangia bacterium]
METLRVMNPATGQLIQEVPAADAAMAAAAIARARAAQPAWGGLPFRERARILRRLARALRDDATFLDTLCAESGKPRY